MHQQKPHIDPEMNRNDISDFLGISPITFDTYRSAGTVEGHPDPNSPAGKLVFDVRTTVKALIRSYVANAKARRPDDDDPLRVAKIDETVAKARKTELEVAEREGSVVQATLVQQVFASTMREVAVWIDALPDTLERTGIIDKRGVDKIRDSCDIQRQSLYDKLKSDLLKQMAEQQPDQSSESNVEIDRGSETTDTGKRGRGRPRKTSNPNT